MGFPASEIRANIDGERLCNFILDRMVSLIGVIGGGAGDGGGGDRMVSVIGVSDECHWC